ncbi:STAS-like domain-containing protein [Mariniblastus sp.]|nr:STAS-like domain-containing protein [Mariniblastus sp.]
MSLIPFPNPCHQDDLIQQLDAEGLLDNPPDKIALHLTENTTVFPSAMAWLAAWGIWVRKKHGTELVITGDETSRAYLASMDLLDSIASPFSGTFEQQKPAGRFMPITLVDDDKGAKFAVDSICDLVLHQFENPKPFLPALEWCISEITDNILIHSDHTTPGVICAQYYDSKHRLDVAIVDCGRGLMDSLGETTKIWSHGDAISKAVQRGVTRNEDIGMGNGLAGTLEIAAQNGGDCHIWTGDATLRIIAGKDKGFVQHGFVPGTGVYLSLDTRKPVNLADTFIQGDGLGTEFITATIEVGGLRVADEVEHYGSRVPATHFRRKVMTLLNESDDQLTLDFEGVNRASSSFLDELLGRMVKELGFEQFKQRVKVINVKPAIATMANVVIQQRMEGLG